MRSYHINEVGQYSAQQPAIKEFRGGIGGLVLKLCLAGISVLALGCSEQYQVNMPPMGRESHSKFERMVQEAFAQKGVLDRFQNPANVSEGEIEAWYKHLLANTMYPPEFNDKLEIVRR